MQVRIRAFRAVDEPENGLQFVAGHHEALAAHNIRGLGSAAETWPEHPFTWVIVAERQETQTTQTLLAGIRVQVADGSYRLPVEGAVGSRDPRLINRIRGELDRGVGEICGFWKRPTAMAPGALTTELALSAIALARGIGLRQVYGLAPTHTLDFWHGFGYRVERDLGCDGGFVYPDERYLSRVVSLDIEKLSETPVTARGRIANLQHVPRQSRQLDGQCRAVRLDYDLSLLKSVRPLPFVRSEDRELLSSSAA